MNATGTVVATGLLLIAVSAVAAAQARPRARDGVTIGFGVGAASRAVTCSFCETSRRRGTSEYLRVGGALRPDVVVALDIRGWGRGSDGCARGESGSGILATGMWYPRSSGGFHLAGGAGFGGISVRDRTRNCSRLDSVLGYAYHAGAGYDWPIRSNFSLSPYIDFLAVSSFQTTFANQRANQTLRGNGLLFGLGFAWHLSPNEP